MPDEILHTLSTPAGQISYVLRRSMRRRTMEISILSERQARVTAPRFVSLPTIEKFIYSRSDWIIKRIVQKRFEEEKLKCKKYETGHTFLFMGQAYPIVIDRQHNYATKVSFSGTQWNVRANTGTTAAMIRSKLIAWYRREAGEILGSRIFHYSRVMGLVPQKITVKTQKRLWGSCNYHGKSINLNWILVMAPLAVIDYVVVHELCHLEVPNHSQRFWKKVIKFMPEYQKSEKWLKTHAVEMRLP